MQRALLDGTSLGRSTRFIVVAIGKFCDCARNRVGGLAQEAPNNRIAVSADPILLRFHRLHAPQANFLDAMVIALAKD